MNYKALLFIPIIVIALERCVCQGELKILEDIVYASYGERELRLDLFRPDNGKVYPGIVLIHGGGWHEGNKVHYYQFAELIAREGYVCLTIEYRLSGEATFPAAIFDCKAAVRWLRANASQYKTDPDKIASLGGSAGGHLSALLATTSQVTELEGNGGNQTISSKVAAAVIFEAPLDQYGKHKGKTREDTPANSLNFFGGTCDELAGQYKLGSPIRFIDLHTPPVLLISNGENEYMERIPFQKRLNNFGIGNEHIHFEGGKHGDWIQPPLFDKYVNASIQFLDRHLK